MERRVPIEMYKFKIEKYQEKPYGRLSVIADSGERTLARGAILRCLCTCGTIKNIAAESLVSGKILSCGCYGKERRRKGCMEADRKLTSKQRDNLVDLYLSVISTVKLANNHGCSHPAIITALRSRGVNLRNNSDCQRKHSLNEEAFSVISKERDYWCGFLAADGCVYKNAVCLTLNIRDIGHIEKFQGFINSSHSLHINKNNGAQLFVNSQKMVDDLAQFGIVERKSHTFQPCEEHRHNKEFWRGVVDGDGHVAFRNGKHRLELCGSKPCMDAFLEWCVKNTKTNASVRPMKSIYRVGLASRPAQEIQRLLYEDAIVSLNRKYNTYIGARNILIRALSDPTGALTPQLAFSNER